MASLNDQLDRLLNDPDTLVLDTKNRKYVVISDLHLGNRSPADDFRRNASTVVRALQYYHNEGYGLILLGDVEELWQFDLPEIVDKYNSSIYEAIRSFGADNVWRVFGNHDIDWSVTIGDPVWPSTNTTAHEALKFRDISGDVSILLVHGHQATKDADKFSWIGRPAVHFYRLLENMGINFADPTPSATKSNITKDYEKKRYDWARQRKQIIICGHSHRAIFAAMSRTKEIEVEIERLQSEVLVANSDADKAGLIAEIRDLTNDLQDERRKGRDITPVGSHPLPCYFNSGCCLYETGITLLEIDGDRIELAKWGNSRVLNKTSYGTGSVTAFLADIRK